MATNGDSVTGSMFRHRFLLVLYPAQGHIKPALQLAKRLIALGAHVTVSTTLFMHNRITPKPSVSSLSLLPFSDGHDNGFSATSLDDYSLYASLLKRRGTDFLTDLFSSTAQQHNPFTCVVYTPLLNWVAELAREFHIPAAMLWPQPATVLDIFYYYFHGYSHRFNTSENEKAEQPVELPGLPLSFSRRDLPSFLLGSNPSLDPMLISMFAEQINGLDAEPKPTILVNTFEALEPEALRAVDKFNMIPIGPLFPSGWKKKEDPDGDSFGGDVFEPSGCGYMEWLDSMAERTVVYLSFGSFCVLSKKQTEEIARALLERGAPFLWVIREESGGKMKVGEEEGELRFREELEEKGKIVKWCSQVEVLSHPSVACFVSHCGWNSSIESLVSGVPMVAFPQWTDQKTNAKLIEEVWKIGVRVDGGVNEEGVVGSEEMKKCLEVVLEGEDLRRNALKWKGLAAEALKEGGFSEKYLKTFLDSVAQDCTRVPVA